MSLKIVSGGQTGADLAGVDFAIEQKLEWGGWVPRGFLCEGGKIASHYKNFQEHTSPEYPPRTEANIVDSDGTAIFFRAPLVGGSALTRDLCARHKRPLVLINIDKPENLGAMKIIEFLKTYKIKVLNVAGNRQSRTPNIHARTKGILTLAWLKFQELGFHNQD